MNLKQQLAFLTAQQKRLKHIITEIVKDRRFSGWTDTHYADFWKDSGWTAEINRLKDLRRQEIKAILEDAPNRVENPKELDESEEEEGTETSGGIATYAPPPLHQSRPDVAFPQVQPQEYKGGGKTKKYKKTKKRRKTRRRKKPKKITIVGYPSCDYYIKARRAAKAFFGASNVTDIKFSSKLKYRNWLKKKDGIKFSSKAKSHKTCPFVWTNNKKYVGGCDDTLVLIKKLKEKT